MKLDTLSLLLGILIGILIVVILLAVYALVVNCWEALRDREEEQVVDLPALAAEKESISCALAEIVPRCEWIKVSEKTPDYAKALDVAIEYLENRREEIDEIQQEEKSDGKIHNTGRNPDYEDNEKKWI